MKRLHGILISITIIVLVFAYICMADNNSVYYIKDPHSMDELTKDELVYLSQGTDIEEMFIYGYYTCDWVTYIFKIFEDGNGVIKESVFTSSEKAKIENIDDDSKNIQEHYVEMINDLPDGEYLRYYKINVAHDELLQILEALAEDSFEVTGYIDCSGDGLGYGIDLYLNEKAAAFHGRAFQPGKLEDINIELKHWIEDIIIPLMKKNAEEIDQDEYATLYQEFLRCKESEYSFVETS